MARIAGVEIPSNKKIWVALTKIYGIGRTLSFKILREAKISPEILAKDLTPEQINTLKEIIEKNYKIEGELRREKMQNIKRLKDIGCWRGIRHIKGLPVRGQTTRRNSRTVRGNVRRTVTSGRRPPPSPT
ncbi:MAG TPA: 30S ribosomal protein S13 [bacterium]|nr:30S ribosomal protein S13 [bacterium]